MKYLLLPILLGALSLTGCNKEESERKASIEKQADAMEKAGDAAKDNAKAAAHQKEADGEATKKAMDNAAENKREEKKAVNP